MNTTDAVWLAGVIEATGSFSIQAGKYPRFGLRTYRLDLAERVARLLGTEAREYEYGDDPAYYYVTRCGRETAKVIMEVTDYLTPSRAEEVRAWMAQAI